MYHPEYPRISVPKRHIQYDCGAGTLSSYYENGVESESSKKIKYDTNEHARGPLQLFPRLDVMPGSASAVNDAYSENWAIEDFPSKNIDVSVLNFEEMLGALHGYRVHNNTGWEDDSVNQFSKHSERELFTLSGANINAHAAQAPHGRHDIDPDIAALAASVASQHNMGEAQQARDAGLEREKNPAINAQESGKGEAFENPDTLGTDAPMAIPMDIDAIEINGIVTHPSDTDVVLGANQTN